MKHRRLILISLLLGIATTIGLAWVLAVIPGGEFALGASVNTTRNNGEPMYVVVLSLQARRGGGRRSVQMYVLGPQGLPRVAESWRLTRANEPLVRAAMASFPDTNPGGPWPTRAEWPGWLPGLPESAEGAVGHAASAAGWPMVALRSVGNAAVSNGSMAAPRLDWRWAYRVRPASAYRSQDPAAGSLPLQPIWPGFVVNSGAFAACWWGLLGGTGLLRRVRRRKTGRCVACGYDLRGGVVGGVCPECGAGGLRGGA